MSKAIRGHGKWRYFLPSVPQEVCDDLLIDEEGLYSVSSEDHADVMTAILRHLQVDTVLDGTACVGGNVHSMASGGFKVWACEKDPARCHMLRHNLGVLKDYGDYEQPVDVLECSVHAVLGKKVEGPDFPVDAIVLDPPWGGPSYTEQKSMELYLDKIPLRKIVKHAALRGRSNIFQLKVPKNYRVGQLLDYLEDEAGLVLQLVLDVQLKKFDVLTLVFFNGKTPYVNPRWVEDSLYRMPGVRKVVLSEQGLKTVKVHEPDRPRTPSPR